MLHPASAGTIAGLFGLGDGAVLSDAPVARGKQGQVWCLDTQLGRWAVKETFRPLHESEITGAAEFQEAVRATGVLVPRVIRSTEGALLARVNRTQVRVYAWVELLAPDIDADPVLIGRTVGGIHRVRRSTREPLDEWYSAPVGADRWDRLVAELRAARAPFSESLAQMRDELIALEEWIEPARRLQTCHRDLWADNILPTPAGDVCVIDWDGCGPADPSQELACVLFEFGSGSPGRTRALYRAYVDADGPGRVENTGCFSMLIAQLGHIGEAACRDWLQPNARSPRRADSASWFAELVERPHHRHVLREILDAVS